MENKSRSKKSAEQNNSVLLAEDKKSKLEAKEKRILKIKEEIGTRYWEMGRILKEIKDDKLYLEKAHFFEEYCLRELGFSKDSVYAWIRIYEEFDVELAQQWGYSKLQVMLPLPKESREVILETYSPDTTRADLREIVRDFKDPFKVDVKIDPIEEYLKNTIRRLNDTIMTIESLEPYLYGCKIRGLSSNQEIIMLVKKLKEKSRCLKLTD